MIRQYFLHNCFQKQNKILKLYIALLYKKNYFGVIIKLSIYLNNKFEIYFNIYILVKKVLNEVYTNSHFKMFKLTFKFTL